MDSQIAKVTKDLTTAADMRKTTQMLMQPNANWEEYLTPAPLSIAIMGELVFISSGTDFSINKNPPENGFRPMKFPESFRACLMQVCNSGWQAFNIAHKNMDQIRIYTASVPEHMKAAVKILFQGNDEIIEKLLPKELENIRTIADECVDLADGVEKKYHDVICLIQELLEACINAKHVYGEDLEKVKNKKKENKLREQTAKELNEKCNKAMEAMEKHKALSLCDTGIAICEQIETYSPEETWDKKATQTLITGIKRLHLDAQMFDSMSKKKSGTPAFAATPPMMAKAQANAGQQSPGQQASENARFRIDQSREQLKQCREEYDKAVERMERNKKELTDILVEMQNCKIQEIEFDTTSLTSNIKMLVKGMDAMGRVKEQWEKMVCFFKMVADIVKTSLSKTMIQFADKVEDVQTLSYNSKLFNKDLLYNQAFQASNIASLVHMISGTYCEVSNKYLMDRVSSLSRLMTMDKDHPKFLLERQKLQISCKEAQDNILKLVLKNKKEFEKNTVTRMKQIEGGLRAVLPAA